MGSLLMIAGGLLIAGVNTWQRLGRTPRARSWADAFTPEGPGRSVLVLWPLIAVVLLAAGLTGLLADAGASTTLPALVAFAALLLWFGYLMLPLPVPRVVQPRWYRERVTRTRRAARG